MKTRTSFSKALSSAALMTAIAIAFLMQAVSTANAAVQDPERNSTTPTGWHFWVNRTKAEIDQLAQDAGERVINVQVVSTSPLLFTAVMVKNTGTYHRISGWSYGTEADVTNAINNHSGRLIDLDPYTVNGQRRFAYVWVENSGEAAKGWHWNYDLTVDQVTHEINQYGVRLIDLDTYVVNGQRRYSYIGIANQGVDGKAWWWWPDVTPQFVQQMAQQNDARLINLERPSAGLMTVIMVHNDENAYSRHVYDYTLDDLLRFQASNGIRITDLEQYVKNGNTRYAATLIENSPPEDQRIRALWRSSTMADAPNGTDAWFGIYAKEVSGPVDVSLGETLTNTMLSVLKLVPHFYIMDLYDNDQVNLQNPHEVPWVSLHGQPESKYCPYRDGVTQVDITYKSVEETLSLALLNSDDLAHESLVNHFGSSSINARVHQLGLVNTSVFPGCPQPPGQNDWTHNTSTLRELGEMFEGVDTKAFFPNHWKKTSDKFYGLMADWTGTANTGLRNVVADEASKVGKSAIVNEFMSHITLHGKGGGAIIPQADGTFQGGRSFFGRLELPFVTGPNKKITLETFVSGYFVDNFTAPCNEDEAANSPSQTCRNWKKKQDALYQTFFGEPYRIAIRKALATWPNS